MNRPFVTINALNETVWQFYNDSGNVVVNEDGRGNHRMTSENKGTGDDQLENGWEYADSVL